MRNGVIATGLLALALAGTGCGEGGKATPQSQGGGGPYRQPTSAPPMSPPGGVPSVTASATASAGPSESPSVSPSESAAPVGPATVDAKRTSMGMILVDGKGRTVYLFEKDTNGKPTCADACLKEWPPFLTEGKPVAGTGVKSAWLSTVTWPDGKTQVTYHNHPLYYYAGDTSPGEMKGQGMMSFGGKWYVVGADTGEAMGAGAQSGSPAPSGSPGSPAPSGSPGSPAPTSSPTG